MAKLTNYKTGETLEGHISEGLAGALQDAAGESEEGAVLAYRDERGTWQYVHPTRDEVDPRYEVLTVFCDA